MTIKLFFKKKIFNDKSPGVTCKPEEIYKPEGKYHVKQSGARERTQQLRVLTAPEEDRSWVSGTHMELRAVCRSSLKGSDTFFWPLCVLTHT